MENKILYWTPRVLGIAMVVFISLFATDVFSQEYEFGEMMVALFMHLLPTFALIAILIFAWKCPKIGGWIYVALGLMYIVMAKNEHWLAWLLISGPLFLIGILFVLQKKKQI